MNRQKNNLSCKKDVPGVKNKTEKLNSIGKGATSISTAKKTPLLTSSSNYYHQSYEKPKTDRASVEAAYKKKDQNLMKSFSSYNGNNNQQSTYKETNKIVQPKQDRMQMAESHKADQKALSSPPNNKAQQFGCDASKSKQYGNQVGKPSSAKAISISASQSRDVRPNVSCESKTFNPVKIQFQNNANNGTQRRDKFIADYVANVALVRTMKHMWAGPKKAKDTANPMKCSSYVASQPKLKSKSEQLANSNLVAHYFWAEQTTNKAKNNSPENFFVGQSKSEDKVEGTIAGTEIPKSNQAQSFENEKLKAENQELACKEIKEEDLQSYLLEEPALTALYIGLPAELVKRAIKEKLKENGSAFTSTRELKEAVLKLQKQTQVSQGENSAASNIAMTSSEFVLNKAQEEEGKFVDRKMLEEIKMLKREKLCKICLDNQVGVVFLPCGHLVACIKCAENVKNCPLCRVEIQSGVKTFLS